MSTIQDLYIQFLQHFPTGVQPVISIVLVVIVAYAVYRIIKKDFIFIIVLIVLLPGSIPILQSVWSGVVTFLQFLLKMK